MQKLLGLILNKGQTLSQSQILGHYHIETLPHGTNTLGHYICTKLELPHGDYHIGVLPHYGTNTMGHCIPNWGTTTLGH